MPRHDTFMTQEGYDNIKSECEMLETQRPDFVKSLTQAADMGDRSENAAYSNAKRKLRQTDSRIRFLKKILDFTQVAKPTQTNQVEIGSKVRLRLNGNEFIFHIVGLHEADPEKKKISYRSPVGSALLGRKVGERVTIAVSDREIEYEILGISI